MKQLLLLTVLLATCCRLLSQNVGIGTNAPHASALLEVKATDKGILIPRVTSGQRTAIVAPAQGLMVFDIETSSFWFYNGFSWVNNAPVGFNLPYFDEAAAAVPTLTIRNNGAAAGIRGMGITGPGLYGHGSGGGLAGAAIRAENVHSSGIGFWSITNSNDANTVISNPGTGDLIRGFSGPGAGNLVYRVLNNGTLTLNGNLGVGNASPSARLDVAGTVKIVDGTQGTNKVLTSDASGNARWEAPVLNPAGTTFFHGAKTGNSSTHDFRGTVGSSEILTVSFPAEYADAGGNYNSTTSTYTIPSSGYYHFHATVTFDQFNGTSILYFNLDGGIIKTARSNSPGDLNSVDLDYDGFFSAGSQVKIQAYIPANSTVALRHSASFSGWKVY